MYKKRRTLAIAYVRIVDKYKTKTTKKWKQAERNV